MPLDINRSGANASASDGNPPGHELPQVALLTTGGTIAMRIDPELNAPVPALNGDELLASLPSGSCKARIEIHNLLNVASNCMGPAIWRTLTRQVQEVLARPDISGIVISHGTDTLEETAWWLDLTIDSAKPVVLTGAQRDASQGDYDGPRNLADAIAVAASPMSRGQGVVIVMCGRICAARFATKSHTMNPDAFRGGEAGYLGRVTEGQVQLRQSVSRHDVFILPSDQAKPRVDIVQDYAGANADAFTDAVARGAQGVVVQGFGMGNVSPALYEGILQGLAKGVKVVISTRVPHGEVRPYYGYIGGGKMLAEAGVIMASDLPAHKARILLMLALSNGITRHSELQALFLR